MRQARAGHDTCGQRVTLRCRWAGAWPGFDTTRQAKLAARTARGRAATHRHTQRPGTTGVKGAGETCRGAVGRGQGLDGLRDDAPRHTPARQSPPMWRAPEGPEGLAAVPVGGGGTWPDNESTRRAAYQRPGTTGVEGAGGTGGHGRASRSTTPSRQARVWRSRGRPGPTAPGTPVGPQETQHRGAGPQARTPSATTQILRSTCVPCRSARAARRWRRSSRSPRLRRQAGPRR